MITIDLEYIRNTIVFNIEKLPLFLKILTIMKDYKHTHIYLILITGV